MNRLKVLWFVNKAIRPEAMAGSGGSGTGGWLENLARVVFPHIDLHIAYIDPYGPIIIQSDSFTSHAIRPQQWRLRLIARSLFNMGYGDGSILHQTEQIIEEIKPDIIDIHGTEKTFGDIIPFARRKNIPVLITLQGIISAFEKHSLGTYDQQFLRRFIADKGGRLQSVLPKRVFARHTHLVKQAAKEKTYLANAEFVSGRTYWDKGIAKLFNPNVRYFHIDRILRRAFYDKKWSTPRQNEQLCLHTTLGDSLGKGFEIIAETAALFKDNNIRFHWTVAGISETAMSARAAKKKLGPRYPEGLVSLLDRLSQDDLIDQMLQAHVYVMASHMENSPNNLAEAMCLGMPCVATFAGGTGSYIRNFEDGILVQPGDPYGLAGAILHLKDNTDLAVTMGGKARQQALERHDPERVKQQILNTYATIAADYQLSK